MADSRVLPIIFVRAGGKPNFFKIGLNFNREASDMEGEASGEQAAGGGWPAD